MTAPTPEFLAGYKLALEEASKIATGWETYAAGDDYMTDGRGRFWDAGNVYDQARLDAGQTILLQGKERLRELMMNIGKQNPNRCEDCIGEDRPEAGFDYADTGLCGNCGTWTDVWDVPHLAALACAGKRVYADDGITRLNRPIRDDHGSEQGTS